MKTSSFLGSLALLLAFAALGCGSEPTAAEKQNAQAEYQQKMEKFESDPASGIANPEAAKELGGGQ